MDFKVENGEKLRTRICKKASATVIEAGDIVAISSGLIIKAVAASAKIAYAPKGAGDGETEIEVTEGCDFTLRGTGDAAFAVAQRGTEVDLVVNSGAQQIDVGASSTDVFIISPDQNAGVVDSAADIEVRINPTKVLF